MQYGMQSWYHIRWKEHKSWKKIRDNMWDRGPDPTPKDFMYMKNEPEKREKKW